MKHEDSYSIEEREKQIAAIMEKSKKGKRQVKRIKKSTLVNSAAVKTLITQADLEHLVKDKYSKPVVSLYLTFTPEKVIRERKVFLSVFNSLKATELRKRKLFIDKLNHDQHETIKSDLGEITAFLENFDAEDTKSLIIFKSGKELNEVVKLPVRVRDFLAIDVDPYIVPLQALLEQYKKLLIVEVTKERSIFSTYHLGYTEDIDVLKSHVRSNKVDKSIPGKAQRHRLTYLQRHLKETSLRVHKYFKDYKCALIFIYGTDSSLLSEFTDYLGDDLREKIIASDALSPHETKKDLHISIEKAIENYRSKQEEVEITSLNQYQANGVLSYGLSEVLEAMNRFIIRKLIIDEELSESGFICNTHHYLALTDTNCPYCKKSLLPAENIVDELVELALLHEIEIVTIKQKKDLLKKYFGIVARTYEVL